MSTMSSNQLMSRALQLAECGRLTVSPNPMVGCLIVNDGNIVGEGYHQQAGGPHAEVFALRQAGEKAQGAQVYLTLEPCCHQGRTPPCTLALIQAGVKKVYVACQDPNPLVAGKGIEALREAGIEVELGLCQREAISLNAIFFHYITHKRPYVIAKWAMSLDGKTSVAPKDSRQLSGPASQHHTHQVRHHVDAILVGARTACQDNPQLTVRLTGENETIVKHPVRVVLSGRHQLPLHLNVFDNNLPGKTIVVSINKNHRNWYKSIISEKLELIIVPKDKNGRIFLPVLMDELAKREITSLLVEGGMTVHDSFFAAGLVNKVQVYLAPYFIGSMDKKKPLRFMDFSRLGSDAHCILDMEENTHV